MRQRVALAISSLVATAVLAVGLTAAGFGPAPGAALGEEADTEALDTAATTAEAEDAVEPEIVYVKPAPTPRTVVVKKPAKQQKATRSGSGGARQVRISRSQDDDDGVEHRREREREAAKERRESRREAAKERREREDEDEDEDD